MREHASKRFNAKLHFFLSCAKYRRGEMVEALGNEFFFSVDELFVYNIAVLGLR